MRAPSFWWRPRPTLAARALAPVAAAVGAITARRMRRDGADAGVPVICVGNPTVGGSGKTPVAIAIAAALRAAGATPVFLLRGYGGALEGPVRVSGHGAEEVGDEALLLAAAGPTVVARDRPAGARLARTLGDVVVMDDGFQNPSLRKTLALLVVDRAAGLGNGLCLPAGPLRAPLSAHLPLAHGLVVVTGDEAGAAPLPAVDVPVYGASVAASAPGLPAAVVAFAGIGRPAKFFASVERLGARLIAAHAFPDHHAYSEDEARRLLGAGLPLVTTRKDQVRLIGAPGARGELARRALVVDVTARLDEALGARAVAAWHGRG